MFQARKTDIPKLLEAYQDENVKKEVKENLLAKTNTFINCIRGEFAP
jgi:hypothetical protein